MVCKLHVVVCNIPFPEFIPFIIVRLLCYLQQNLQNLNQSKRHCAIQISNSFKIKTIFNQKQKISHKIGPSEAVSEIFDFLKQRNNLEKFLFLNYDEFK